MDRRVLVLAAILISSVGTFAQTPRPQSPDTILRRNSDESFNDYKDVNGIITLNRWASRMKDGK